MGLKVKSDRNENDPLEFNIGDMGFLVSFDDTPKKVKLDEKGLILLKKAIDGNKRLSFNKKRILAGDYEVLLNCSVEVNELWIKAFDKLVDNNFIEKDAADYVVTFKGIEYLEDFK